MIAMENMRSRFNFAAGLAEPGILRRVRAAARRTLAGMSATDVDRPSFVAHRNLLFTVAYEMLGSAADAEDVLQEAWLRWAEVRARRRCWTRAPTWSASSPASR